MLDFQDSELVYTIYCKVLYKIRLHHVNRSTRPPGPMICTYPSVWGELHGKSHSVHPVSAHHRGAIYEAHSRRALPERRYGLHRPRSGVAADRFL